MFLCDNVTEICCKPSLMVPSLSLSRYIAFSQLSFQLRLFNLSLLLFLSNLEHYGLQQCKACVCRLDSSTNMCQYTLQVWGHARRLRLLPLWLLDLDWADQTMRIFTLSSIFKCTLYCSTCFILYFVGRSPESCIWSSIPRAYIDYGPGPGICPQ